MNSERKLTSSEVVKIEAIETETSNLSESYSAGEFAPKKQKVLRKKPIQKPKTYSKISQENRKRFIGLVNSNEVSIRDAAEKCGIKFSTAKAILKTFRKDGRIGKKKTRDRRILSIGDDISETRAQGNTTDTVQQMPPNQSHQTLERLLSYQPQETNVHGFYRWLQGAHLSPNDQGVVSNKLSELQSFVASHEIMTRVIKLTQEEIIRTLIGAVNNPQPISAPTPVLLPSIFPQMQAALLQPSSGLSYFNLSFLPQK